ncbi:MAG: dockerin type I repeat-containing protein [Phycisphaeraceae bacterium]|nr:dockerin type I repeat-containing protein [Phycisphaeraceae bacterium]
MRRTFLSTGSPQTEDKRWYVLQNWRQDAAVIISDAGVQRERAFYSPYGRVFGMPAGDLNFDGEFTSAEATTISGWSAGYRAYADINLDGVIDGDDATANTPGTLGWDALSRDGSTIGMTGATFSKHIPVLAFLRQGVYHTGLGRLIHRSGNASSVGVGFGKPCYSPCGCGVAGANSLFGCSIQPVIPDGSRCVGQSSSLTDCLVCCEGPDKAIDQECSTACFLAFESPLPITLPPRRGNPNPMDPDEQQCYDWCVDAQREWGFIPVFALTGCKDGDYLICNCTRFRGMDQRIGWISTFSVCLSKCEQLHRIELDCDPAKPGQQIWKDGEDGRWRSECRVHTCISSCFDATINCEQLRTESERAACRFTRSSLRDATKGWCSRK